MSDQAIERVASWLEGPKRDTRLVRARMLLYFWSGRSFEHESDETVEKYIAAYQDSMER